MSRYLFVDPRVRLAISQWPEDAPRGSVSTFCLEHEISRKTFYAIRKRALLEGPVAALEPRSRRPNRSPNQIPDAVKQEAIQVRAALERSGLDHGPISVHDKMIGLGMVAPSIASLTRIFRQAGVSKREPGKKPRAAFRRFVYPQPNSCWQLDATEYVLTRGRKCVIFQLIDDHSRLAIASHVAWGETSEGALEVVRKGTSKHGVPQRFLSDNGSALNPSRQGRVGQLVAHLNSLGVEAITGRPGKPTTQGKNERFHQTLFRWLDKRPLQSTLGGLQKQVDEFDEHYNHQRPHQALPGRITPAQSWAATPKAEPPRPRPGVSQLIKKTQARPAETIRIMPVEANGGLTIRETRFHLARRYSGKHVYVIENKETIGFADENGTLIIEHPWPEPGTKYVPNPNSKKR